MPYKNKWKSRLLRRPEEARLVRTDGFAHGLERYVLEELRQASEQGLTPSSFDFDGDIVILRLERNESRKPSQEE